MSEPLSTDRSAAATAALPEPTLDEPSRTTAVLRRLAGSGGGAGGAIAILVVLVIAFSIASPDYLSVGNLVNILRQYAFVLILAVGQTLVIITAGIDLSVAATAALSGSVWA